MTTDNSRKLVRRKNKSKIIIAVICIILIAFMLIVAVGLGYYKYSLQALDEDSTETVTLVVAEDSYSAEIAQQLVAQGLIKNAMAFKIYCRINHTDNLLKAGTYEFSPSMSINEIASALSEGTVVLNSFTVIDGYSLNQIAEQLEQQGLVAADTFLAQAVKANYAADYEFLDSIPDKNYNSLEGFLFPDTYLIDQSTHDADAIIRMMLDRFSEIAAELNLTEKAKQLNLSVYQLVTVASLIEKEAQLDSERAVIAQVIYNRQAEDMPLQLCSTVIYAWDGTITEVLNEHLEIDSPYNTYKFSGLPPGPIASPGYDSLKAAANPDSDSDYLYFVANDKKNDGSHVFANTFEEHQANIDKYQL